MPEGNLYDFLHKRNNTLELPVVLWMGIGISKGMDYEKPSGQYLGLICDELLTYRSLNSNPGQFRWYYHYPCFVWRIVFACLMVCI
jgi:hypothetical protein